MTDAFERAVHREELADERKSLQQNRTGLVIHATVYVAVNIMLVVIWALTSTEHPWFVYPLLGWGIGLAAHTAAYRSQKSRVANLAAELAQGR